jgi:sugar transferase (PEP-CTERM/EpsH1 system associated)
MKGLFVLPYVPSLIRVRPYHLLRELARRHEIDVLAIGAKRDESDAAHLRSFCRRVELLPISWTASVRSCAAAAARGDPLQAAVCTSPRLRYRLDELLAGEHYDVVHVEHLRAARVSTWLPHAIPTLYDAVDCISLLQERTLRSSTSLRQRLQAAVELRRTRAYEARLIPRFDRVAVTSPVDAAALRILAPGAEIAVVPNGVDLDYFRPCPATPRAPEPDTLVFSGKMSYHANVTAVRYFVREVLPLIRRSRPDVRLRIAGSAPPASIRALAVDPAITVTGHVADIRQPLRRAAVAVCPVTVKVGIQNKILEAMAMALPVVSTRLGAEGLGAQPGADFLVADDPPAFAAHVTRLLADATLRARVGSAGRRYVEAHHRWDLAARRIESLYYEAAARRRARLAAG